MPRAGLTARAALQPKNASGEDHTPIPITSAVVHQAEIARGDATPACGAFAGADDRVHRQACRRRAQPALRLVAAAEYTSLQLPTLPFESVFTTQTSSACRL